MSDLKAVSVCHWILITFGASFLLFSKNGHCCGKPETPEDGFFTPLQDKYPEGARVTYSCNAGFSLKVNQNYQMYNYCMKNRWNNTSPPNCVKNPTCGVPGIPENGVVTRDEQKNSLRYSCKPGYILLGNSVKTCSRIMTWTPLEIPNCVSNLAYQKKVTNINTNGDTRSIVDGDFNLCNVVVKKSASEIGIDLGRILDFTNILVSFKNGTKITASLKYSNESTNPRNRHSLTDFTSDYVTTPLWYNTSAPGKTRYIFIESLMSKPNDVSICEIQMFNSLESKGCGTPDGPANGAVINESSLGISRYRYKCDIGYSIEGNSVIECRNGQWSNSPPLCKEIPTIPSRTTPSFTIKTITPPVKPTPVTVSPYPTPKPTSKEDDDDSKEKVIGIMAIAIGATAASVVIVVAILIVVCIMKKYYKKKSRLPPCHAEHGPLCNSPQNHYPMYKEYSQPRSQDGSQHSYGEPPIHLYDSIKEHNLRFPLQRPSPDYDLSETVFNEGYGRRPPLPMPRPPLSSSGNSQQYEPLMPIRRNSNPYDEVNEDMVPGTSGRNEPDIMTSSRVDSLYIKGAPRTTL